MKLITSSTIVLAAMLSAAPVAAQTGNAAQPKAAQTPALKISNEAIKAIADLQKTVLANDFANIPAKLQAASAVAKTNEDRYAIAQLQLTAAVAQKDDAASLTAIDAIAATNYLSADKVAPLYSAVGVSFYNAKKLDEAAGAFQKAASLEPQDPEPLEMLAETRNSQGRAAEAAAALQKSMQLSQAAGRTPPESVIKRALSMAYDAKAPNAVGLARQWVAAYPSPTSWRNSIAIYRNMSHPDVEGTLDLMRLLQATGSLTDPSDYELYVTGVSQQGNFVEAQAVLNAGLAAKHIDPASAQFRDLISAVKAKPQPTEADLAEAARTAPSGSTLIRVGDRYFGLGNYAKAAETYRAALTKAGADTDLANLHLGMALVRSGDKAGGTAALTKVGGSFSEIAKFWLLYAQARA